MSVKQGTNRFCPRPGDGDTLWARYASDVIGLRTITDNVVVGGTTMSGGAEKLRVLGGVLVDESAPALADAYLAFADGQNVAVAALGSGAFRYNLAANKMQLSVSGSPWVDIAVGVSAGPWTLAGTDVYPDFANYQVQIGTVGGSIGAENLLVVGTPTVGNPTVLVTPTYNAGCGLAASGVSVDGSSGGLAPTDLSACYRGQAFGNAGDLNGSLHVTFYAAGVRRNGGNTEYAAFGMGGPSAGLEPYDAMGVAFDNPLVFYTQPVAVASSADIRFETSGALPDGGTGSISFVSGDANAVAVNTSQAVGDCAFTLGSGSAVGLASVDGASFGFSAGDGASGVGGGFAQGGNFKIEVGSPGPNGGDYGYLRMVNKVDQRAFQVAFSTGAAARVNVTVEEASCRIQTYRSSPGPGFDVYIAAGSGTVPGPQLGGNVELRGGIGVGGGADGTVLVRPPTSSGTGQIVRAWPLQAGDLFRAEDWTGRRLFFVQFDGTTTLRCPSAVSGTDSPRFELRGQTSAAEQTISLVNEADAASDTYRLRITDTTGNVVTTLGFDAGIGTVRKINDLGERLWTYSGAELWSISPSTWLRLQNLALLWLGNMSIRIDQAAQGGGTPAPAALVNGGAHTVLANAEVVDVDFALNRTVQFSGNAPLAEQRAVVVRPVTYSSDTATKTITKAATFTIVGPPAAGPNVNITNSYAFDVTGNVYFDGKLTVTGLIDPTGVVVTEQATVPGGAPAPGRGTFWVRDDSPNVPMFTDDGGIDHVLTTGWTGAAIFAAALGVAQGDAVYMSAANVVDKADASDPAKRPAVGIVESVVAGSARVCWCGVVNGFAGLVTNRTYYLSAAVPGALTPDAPTGNGEMVQCVGVASNASTLIAMVDRDGVNL